MLFAQETLYATHDPAGPVTPRRGTGFSPHNRRHTISTQNQSMNTMATFVHSHQRSLLLSLPLRMGVSLLCLTTPTWADTATPLIEPPPLAESGESPARPSRRKEPRRDGGHSGPGFAGRAGLRLNLAVQTRNHFLADPDRPALAQFKKHAAGHQNSHKITLYVHGTTTVVDIRERGVDKLVHRYVTGMPNFTTPDKHAVELWTPDGERSFTLGAYESKIAGRSDQQPFTVEVDGAGTVRGLRRRSSISRSTRFPAPPQPSASC